MLSDVNSAVPGPGLMGPSSGEALTPFERCQRGSHTGERRPTPVGDGAREAKWRDLPDKPLVALVIDVDRRDRHLSALIHVVVHVRCVRARVRAPGSYGTLTGGACAEAAAAAEAAAEMDTDAAVAASRTDAVWS